MSKHYSDVTRILATDPNQFTFRLRKIAVVCRHITGTAAGGPADPHQPGRQVKEGPAEPSPAHSPALLSPAHNP